MRGTITENIRTICEKHNIEEINETQLRLLPYIQYLIINHMGLEPLKINSDERGYIIKWKDKGYLQGGMRGFEISKQFWDFINDCLWESYVTEDHKLKDER